MKIKYHLLIISLFQSLLYFCPLALYSCSDNLKQTNEPSRDIIKQWIEQCALPGVSVSEVDSLCVIDQTTKSGRVSVKLRVMRTEPTYVQVYDFANYLSAHGVDFESLNRANVNQSSIPTVCAELLPKGASNIEKHEIKTKLDVSGWTFEPIRVGSSFDGFPAIPPNMHNIKSTYIETFMADVKSKAAASRRAQQDTIDKRNSLLNSLAALFTSPNAYKLQKSNSDDFVIFSLVESPKMEIYRNQSLMRVNLDIHGGYIHHEEGLFKTTTVKDPVVSAHLEASCSSSEKDNTQNKSICRFSITFTSKGYHSDCTFEYDGQKICNSQFGSLEKISKDSNSNSPSSADSRKKPVTKSEIETVLIGTWRDEESLFTFGKNGQFQTNLDSGATHRGKWRIDEDAITLMIEFEGISTAKLKIVEIGENRFKYINPGKGIYIANKQDQANDAQDHVEGSNKLIQAMTNERLIKAARLDADVEAGKVIYDTHCFACHGKNLDSVMVIDGSGTIPLPGLSLMDHKWKFGSNPTDLFKLIAYGSPKDSNGNNEAREQAWIDTLGPSKIAQVTAYIISKVPDDFPGVMPSNGEK